MPKEAFFLLCQRELFPFVIGEHGLLLLNEHKTYFSIVCQKCLKLAIELVFIIFYNHYMTFY